MLCALRDGKLRLGQYMLCALRDGKWLSLGQYMLCALCDGKWLSLGQCMLCALCDGKWLSLGQYMLCALHDGKRTMVTLTRQLLGCGTYQGVVVRVVHIIGGSTAAQLVCLHQSIRDKYQHTYVHV